MTDNKEVQDDIHMMIEKLQVMVNSNNQLSRHLKKIVSANTFNSLEQSIAIRKLLSEVRLIQDELVIMKETISELVN